MTHASPKVIGPGAAARKYDLLTWIGLAGLRNERLPPVMALRLVVLITARYNWAHDEASVGQDELAKLWGVSRRTVIRDVERLRVMGVLEIARPARRGRVASYRLVQGAVAALVNDLAPTLAADLAARLQPESPSNVVLPFPGGAGTETTVQGTCSRDTPWNSIRSRLARQISEAAFARWIAPLRPLMSPDSELRLQAPSAFHADYTQRSYGDLLNSEGARHSILSVKVMA